MPAIYMTRGERSALAKLAKCASPVNELPREHADKLVNHGLAARDCFRLQITTKGQLELIRQRFRGDTARTRAAPAVNGEWAHIDPKRVNGHFLPETGPDPEEQG